MVEKYKRIAVFSHGQKPRLGALVPALKRIKAEIKIFELIKGDEAPTSIDHFDGLILMGGPMGVYERDKYPQLCTEMEFAEKMIQAGKPVLGICLGCQMLAHMHKGEVFLGDKGFSVGFRELFLDHSDDIFGHELKGLRGFSWHGDTYTIGQGCNRLMTGCYYHEQGVKFGEKVYGVQFHPEANEEIISAWYMRDMTAGTLPESAKPMVECLEEAKVWTPKVHAWLDKFIERLFNS